MEGKRGNRYRGGQAQLTAQRTFIRETMWFLFLTVDHERGQKKNLSPSSHLPLIKRLTHSHQLPCTSSSCKYGFQLAPMESHVSTARGSQGQLAGGTRRCVVRRKLLRPHRVAVTVWVPCEQTLRWRFTYRWFVGGGGAIRNKTGKWVREVVWGWRGSGQHTMASISVVTAGQYHASAQDPGVWAGWKNPLWCIKKCVTKPVLKPFRYAHTPPLHLTPMLQY